MRTREKTKIIMSKPDNSNEVVSRREVGVQDNPCTVTTQETNSNKAEPMVAMIDKLMSAVDSVSSKLGTIETRLLSLEGEAKNSTDSDCFVSGIQLPSSEPLFGTVGGVRPKTRKPKVVGSDLEAPESDADLKQRKKKKQERKPTHAITTIPQDYALKLSKHTDKTVVERKQKPTETMTLGEAGLLTQKELQELGNIGLGMPPAQATQFWTVEAQPDLPQVPVGDDQKDLMDFLRNENVANMGNEKKVNWANPPPLEAVAVQGNVNQQGKSDESWKMDPRIQALVAERVQQLDMETKLESLQGKRKRSGRYNTTDNPTSVSYRRWPNEGILVGSARRRLPFDELNMTQFVMGFIKNVNDTLDSLTRQYMLAELYDLMKLADSTSWHVARGAFISSMHSIEDGEIAWSDRGALLQRRMTQTHAAMFSNLTHKTPGSRIKETPSDRKLVCKFFRTGTCRETGDQHVDPLTGLTYTHEQSSRKK